MRRLIYCLAIIGVAILVATPAFPGPVGFYGALSIPTGAFGDDPGEDAGLASTGGGAGVQLAFPVGMMGFSLVADASFLINPIDTDALEELLGGAPKTEAWMNVPILAGVRYDAVASPIVKVYCMGLAGINLARTPEIKWSGLVFMDPDWIEIGMKQKSGSATSVGLGIGAGLLLADRFDVSLRYLNLGTPEFEVDTELTIDDYTETETIKFEQPISMFLLTAGVRF